MAQGAAPSRDYPFISSALWGPKLWETSTILKYTTADPFGVLLKPHTLVFKVYTPKYASINFWHRFFSGRTFPTLVLRNSLNPHVYAQVEQQERNRYLLKSFIIEIESQLPICEYLAIWFVN
jgi:hypothetical protein